MTHTAVLGYRQDGSPIYLFAGADGWSMYSEPDDGAESEEGELDEEGEFDDEPDEWTPPTQDEWQRQQDAIRRNNAENRNLRLLKRSLTDKGIDLSTKEGVQALADLVAGGDGPSKGKAGDPAVARAVERERAKVEGRYRPVIANLAVKAALADAGFTGTNLSRVMSMLDLDEMDFDADGNVTGIAEQIAEIKADIPDWFRGAKAAPARRGAAEVDAGERRTSTKAGQTWKDQLERQITRGR